MRRAGRCGSCPNKFPALRIEGELEPSGEGLYDRTTGVGAHEVIIETPDHAASLATLPPERVADVLGAYRERILDLRKDPRIQYVMVFKNHGEAAGASLEHAALPAHRHSHRAHHGGGGAGRRGAPLPDSRSGASGATSSGRSAAATGASSSSRTASWPWPPSPRAFPSRPGSCPRRTDRASRTPIRPISWPSAGLLGEILRRMGKVLGDPPYNFMLHSAPLRTPGAGPLPLAPRDHPQAHAGGRVRVGHGFLHQPDPPRGSGALSARRGARGARELTPLKAFVTVRG